jgi:hypothetical protein
MRLTVAILFTAAMAAAPPIVAQDIPPYVPANPVLESRSALYAQPFVAPHVGWQLRFVADYYNAVEVSHSTDLRQSIFDAEVLQGDLWVTRDLSRRVFVVADLPVRGAYSGFLDGFLNWYHKVIGLGVPARDELPIDHFQWTVAFPDTTVERTRPGTFLGDLRGGIGLRLGRTQFVASATLPSGSIGPDGWTRHVIGTSLAATTQLVRNSRVIVDGEASVGITPTEGALARYQRSVFVSGSVSGRWRFAGRQALFGTVWAQSGSWQGTGFETLEDAEVTFDFGFLLRPGRHWPELQIGMTQDLVPRGPAMDVGFTAGVRW